MKPSRETSAATPIRRGELAGDASRVDVVTDASRAAAADASQAPGSDASRLEERRVCTWCRRQIPESKRADARTCSQPCRQAAHRFRVGVAPADATERPCRFAYADPPYPGLSRRYYGDEPTFAGEVDHRRLVEQLCDEYPDGWALSTSAASLGPVLRLCPEGVRVASWVKGPRASESRRALNAWEPLVLFGGRARRVPVAEDLCDVLLWGGRQPSHPGALVGMKPAAFCEWMFRLLGAQKGDELADLYPGSGAVARAWTLYTSSGPGDALPSCLAGATRRLLSLVPANATADNRHSENRGTNGD